MQFATAATLALAAVLVFHLVRFELAAEVYVLVIGAATLVALVLVTCGAAAQPSGFERALQPPAVPQPTRPLELDRLEREVTLGVSSAFHLHHKLLPLLREVATQRLADRRGSALTAESVSADTWELLRPEGPEGFGDRFGRGLPIDRLEALTGELERI